MPDDTFTLGSSSMRAIEAPHHCAPLTLIDLPTGATARVQGVRAGQNEDMRDLALRLLEIGFVEGEPVRVVAHGHPGREPVAVRIGGTTFALRRFEAERVLVAIESGHDPTQ